MRQREPGGVRSWPRPMETSQVVPSICCALRVGAASGSGPPAAPVPGRRSTIVCYQPGRACCTRLDAHLAPQVTAPAGAGGAPAVACPLPLCFDSYITDKAYLLPMAALFEVLAEPHRRSILDLLRESERSVTDLVGVLGVSQPAVSKHLRVLREAGLVTARPDAQRRMYRLRPDPLRAIDEWLEPYRRLWAASLDALERHLDSMPTDGGDAP